MNIDKKYYRGITLVESLVTMVILAGFTFMMMSVFTNLQIKNIKENSKTSIHNYCHRTLDKIAGYTMNAIDGISTTGFDGGFPTYRLQIIEKDLDGNPIMINNEYVITNLEIKCSVNEGILIDGKAPYDNFFEEDPTSLTTYKIKHFKIQNNNIPNNIALPPSIIENMNQASYKIILEVDVIYNQTEKIIETLTFNREVFTSNTFVSGESI